MEKESGKEGMDLVILIMENTRWIKNKVMVYIVGQMAIDMKDNLKMI